MRTHFVFNTILGLLIVSVNITSVNAQAPPSSMYDLRGLDSQYRIQQLPNLRYKKQNFSTPQALLTGLQHLAPFNPAHLSSSSSCRDTSVVFYLRKDSVVFYITGYVRARDGNLLVSGQYHDYHSTGYVDPGCLFKCDDYGNVLWNKLYDSLNHTSFNYINYYKILELQDGSILLAGATNDLVTENDDLILTKTDNAGNLLWSKVYRSRLWGYGNGSTDYFYVQQMVDDPATGDIYLTGPNWTAGRNILRISGNTGNIAWSKLYQPTFSGSFDNPSGLSISGNEILSFGHFLGGSSFPYMSLYRIDKNTGDTIQTKFYKVIDTPFIELSQLGNEQLKKLNNGNYAMCGQQYGFMHYGSSTAPLYQASIVEFDPNLNFLSAYCFRNNIESNSYSIKTNLHSDGSGMLRIIKVLSGYNAYEYCTQYNNAVIQKERLRYATNEGLPVINEALQISGGDMIIELAGDSINQAARVIFKKFHLTDTSSTCLGMDINHSFIQPFNYGMVLNGRIDSIGSNVFFEIQNEVITAQSNTYDEWLPGCQQTSFCDTLSLTGSADSLCPGMPLLITVHKNLQCGANVLFNFDSTVVQSFTRINDSTYNIIFNAAWQGSIYGSLAGCNTLTDSVFVKVLNSPSSVNLGPDTTICPGNTIVLNAHAGFDGYLWQDGSTDSTFIVTMPGTYYVTTINACGGNSSDTVIVSPHAPIPFSLGPDLIVCDRDTVSLTAPPGFMNYQWSPNYNISSLVSQTVRVYPSVDTLYKAVAELSPGCFASDSVRVVVKPLPFINLGNDASFCSGDSLVINAGGGFLQYLWNTGATSQTIVVSNAGTYSVTGTSANGCKAYDTLKVLQVYPVPVVNLGSDSVLCTGTSRTLDAGNFMEYLWNTGSAANSIVVNTTGIYTVVVTDNNGCKGQGVINISKSVNPPADFLPADTLICSYNTITIPVNGVYTSYLWNTNSTAPAITVSAPGLYWLEVKDSYSCIGKDSISIGNKDCMKRLFIPSAFTPNNDSRNDQFKPLIFGIVQYYEFTIYNRYGQVVFKTSDVSKGWDGYYKDVKQANGAYIWVCKYQFAGRQLTIENGSVLIIR